MPVTDERLQTLADHAQLEALTTPDDTITRTKWEDTAAALRELQQRRKASKCPRCGKPHEVPNHCEDCIDELLGPKFVYAV